MRLGILVSHPIQYYAPWFRYLAERMDIEVFYSHKQDPQGQAAAGFEVEFEWDIPLLDGYPSRWLTNVSARPGVGTFGGLDTPELFEIIQAGRFDSFLLFSWNRKSSWQAIRACRRFGVPVLMRGDSHLKTERSAITLLTKYAPYRAILPRFAAHLYVGKHNHAYLRHYGVPEQKLFFSPHFVDTEFFSRGVEQAKQHAQSVALRKELGIDADSFVFLFVGKLINQKNPAEVLAAFHRILTERPHENLHLLFVGSGPLQPALERAALDIAGKVHFVGFRNQTELPAYYELANVLVLSSRSETWGLVVNEAFACGKPAVVSDMVGCAPDLIDEHTGLCYAAGDVRDLAKQMLVMKERVLRSPETVTRQLKVKSREYSIDAATKGLCLALNSLEKININDHLAVGR